MVLSDDAYGGRMVGGLFLLVFFVIGVLGILKVTGPDASMGGCIAIAAVTSPGLFLFPYGAYGLRCHRRLDNVRIDWRRDMREHYRYSGAPERFLKDWLNS